MTCLFAFLERTQGEDTSAFKVETAANEGGVAGILVDIMRHFSSAHFVEVLHSICRRTIASAADAVGLHLHKVIEAYIFRGLYSSACIREAEGPGFRGHL